MTISVRTAQGRSELTADARRTLIECSRAKSRRFHGARIVMVGLFAMLAGLLTLSLVAIAAYLLVRAIAGFSANYFFQSALPLLWNSLFIAGLSTMIAFPYALCAALCTMELARGARISRLAHSWFCYLRRMPTIVIALVLFVLLGKIGMLTWTLYAAAAGGALIAFPRLYETLAAELRNLPVPLRESSGALGATRMQTAFSVSLPYALKRSAPGFLRTISVLCAEVAVFSALLGNELHAMTNLSAGAQTLATHILFQTQQGTPPMTYTSAVLLLLLIWGLEQMGARWSARQKDKNREEDENG